jgi:hypothetical protein
MSFPNPTLFPSSFALGQNVGDYFFFDDFIDGNEVVDNGGKFSETANQAQWLMTVIDTDTDGGETVVPADAERGGVVTISNNVDALDSLEFQKNGEAFAVNATRDIYFEMRFKVDDADDVRWGCGLATTATAVFDLTASGYGSIVSANDFIGFAAADAADGNIDYISQDDGTPTSGDSGEDMADDTFTTVAFHVIGDDRVKFYVNGAEVGNVSTNVPDAGAALSPWFTIANDGANDGSAVMEIDYIFIAQKR